MPDDVDVRSDGSFSIGSAVWPGTSKLIEEMGELTQVLGKLIATHGGADHWDGADLRERLYEEVADVHAALSFFVDSNNLDSERLFVRIDEKLHRFAEWHATGDLPPALAAGSAPESGAEA